MPDVTPKNSLAPGTLYMGTYRIEKLVAAGGMGEVYKAVHELMEEPVALKILREEFSRDQNFRELFVREAKTLAEIRHRAVVRVRDTFAPEGQLIMLTDFVDGPTIAGRLADGPVSEDDMISIARETLKGLQAAHEAGAIHRDICPNNIILKDGNPGMPVIIDFGIARRVNDPHRTVIGSNFAGKPAYAAPEQVGLFGSEVSPCTDLYSFGLVLLACARGAELQAGSWADIIKEKEAEIPLDGVPEGLQRLLSNLLAPNPADRPSSAREALERFLGEEPRREARSPSPDAPVPHTRAEPIAARRRRQAEAPRSRFRPLVVAGGLAVAVLAILLLGIYAFQTEPAPSDPDPVRMAEPTPTGPESSPPITEPARPAEPKPPRIGIPEKLNDETVQRLFEERSKAQSNMNCGEGPCFQDLIGFPSYRVRKSGPEKITSGSEDPYSACFKNKDEFFDFGITEKISKIERKSLIQFVKYNRIKSDGSMPEMEVVAWPDWSDESIKLRTKFPKENKDAALLYINYRSRGSKQQILLKGEGPKDPDIYVIAVTGVTANNNVDEWWASVKAAVEQGEPVSLDIRKAYASKACPGR